MPPGTTNPDPTQVANREPVQDANLSKSGKVIVGIIYPPPEIRNIVDKTASFVARNGASFEVRIREHEVNNPKFNFLNPGDPYHAYYQQKVQDFIEGKVSNEPPVVSKMVAGPVPLRVQEVVKASEFLPVEPPPEYEFIADPTTINAFDLDLMKLTAQFVARNGRQFLTQLMTRESRNFQFDFLKPQHSNFSYFTRLVEQYSKVMMPLRDLMSKLQVEGNDHKHVLGMVAARVEWERYQRRVREKEEAEAERERLAYSMIDWHDFVVVQTVDFQPHETVGLPPPCTPKDVGARILAQQRYEAHKKATEAVEMEVESDEEETAAAQEAMVTPAQPASPEMAIVDGATGDASNILTQVQAPKPKAAHEVTQPVPAPPKPENVTIRKDYNPRNRILEKAKAEQKWVISPLTGEKVPADKLTEHLKFNTVDQQYFMQKERELMDRQDEELVFAMGADISANIKAFAERRSDIFGVGSKGAEQAMIGKKLGEEDVRRIDPKAIWDGHSVSVEATVKAAQAEISLEDQIAQIHRAQGLLPDKEKDRIGPKVLGDNEAASKEVPTAAAAASSQKATYSTPAPTPSLASSHLVKPVVMVPTGGMNVLTGGMYQPVVTGMPPPTSRLQYPTGGFDQEPSAKRQKTFEETLQPEDDWLKLYQDRGPIDVKVQLPIVPDKPEWKLNGNTLNIQLSLTDQVSVLKSKIQEATGMPASKQKLSYENIFIKDALSLAYYNMLTGSLVQVQLLRVEEMCITFLMVNPNAVGRQWQVVLINNRDEEFDRPTNPAQWRHQGHVLCSVDVKIPGEGTWLGINKYGNIGVTLNIMGEGREARFGRGRLIPKFLITSNDALSYMNEVAVEASDPFNYAGFHGFGNSVRHMSFKKVDVGTRMFESIVAKYPCSSGNNEEFMNELLNLLKCSEEHLPDPHLENLGMHYVPECRRVFSRCFVNLQPFEEYGTRTHTLILIDGDGNVTYVEQNRNPTDAVSVQWRLLKAGFWFPKSLIIIQL
ncbi:Splicing factor 3A subunit 1 [Trichuris trichiura]|uniref:Splicing factor 3A subunit 1 n=1 Tax=Trichuris trichiura TaxID=36087 RepID=A0A077Z627_TRITR|nr:Splicing factor 3A subunit 1 [Trichuris trichiura]